MLWNVIFKWTTKKKTKAKGSSSEKDEMNFKMKLNWNSQAKPHQNSVVFVYLISIRM